jgi:acylphosphatase
MRTVHIRVEGRVQGVGYRAWTEATARSIGLSGWVRNRRDGTVEMLLHGSAEQVGDMLRRSERGPLHARVTKVEILGDGAGAYQSFNVLPDA